MMEIDRKQVERLLKAARKDRDYWKAARVKAKRRREGILVEAYRLAEEIHRGYVLRLTELLRRR